MLSAFENFNGHIFFIGGEVDMRQQSTYGPIAEIALKQLKADKAFIPAGGIDLKNGISEYDLNQAKISQILMDRVDNFYIVADHTKFGETTFAHVCPIKDVSTIITDWNCPDKWKKELSEQGINLVIADEDE